jgi:Arc/MetJ-type ribon-helix-helix transcriptional regulator
MPRRSESLAGQLEASGLSRSEAIRTALVKSAQQERRREVLRQEMAALEADEEDRREMLEVAEFMETLRAEG